MSVGVNPPKTPVTKGSSGIAQATLPNVCKMPGPPAPFVPTPLPNVGKSGDSPKDYSKSVKIQGKFVAIKGASFGSMGDAASKGTGGGIVSANTHGPCKFIGPGSMDVKIEGKNVQLLSDPMTNNGAGSGTPANSATMMGLAQASEPDPNIHCVHCGKPLKGHPPSGLETDDKALIRDANTDLNKNRSGKTVGGMQHGSNPATFTSSGGGDGRLFNVYTQKEIPLTRNQVDTFRRMGNELGNCAEQKLLRRDFIGDKKPPSPPASQIRMGIASKNIHKGQKSTFKEPCGTCEKALIAMFCTDKAVGSK